MGELSNEQRQSTTKLAYYEALTGDLRLEDFQLMRWEIAGLLTVNTGAALAVFNTESLPPIFKLITGLLFAGGALSTFAFAHCARTYLRLQMRTAMHHAVYWRDTVALNARRSNRERHLKTYARFAHSTHKQLLYFKIASATFFILGITAIALQPVISMSNVDNRNAREITENNEEKAKHLKHESKSYEQQGHINNFTTQFKYSEHHPATVASSALKTETTTAQ